MSISSGLLAARLRNASRCSRRSSMNDSEKRATFCFSGSGGTMAPGRSLCRWSKSHAKSEYRRFAEVA